MLTYYTAMDSVLVASSDQIEKQERSAVNTALATGALMEGLLFHDRIPVLSQTQAFDNAALLSSLVSEDRNALALLKLFERSRLQVRLLADPAGRGQATLLRAFESKVRDDAFTFSAWPELNSKDMRERVLAQLAGDKNVTPEAVSARLDALRNLDNVLRRSQAVEEIAGPPSGATLGVLSRQQIDLLSTPDEETAAARRRLYADINAQPTGHENKRAVWYAAIDRGRREHPELDLFHDKVKLVVDLAYNEVIFASLGVPDMILATEASAAVARDVSDDSPQLDFSVTERHAVVVKPSDIDGWLNWQQVGQMLSDLDMIVGVDQKVRFYRRERVNALVKTEQDGSLYLQIVTSVPPDVATALASAGAGTAVGTAAGSLISGVVTAVVGAAASAPISRRLPGWILARDAVLRRRRIEGRQTILTSGKRSWRDRLRNR
ncbi:hypothetical protein [Kribbella sp. NPDC049584]|uniref:hypothetical protein n=1 Tax=Kribbella sp. NPDC049584 TaxID=3154833 RepID=UPI00342B2432